MAKSWYEKRAVTVYLTVDDLIEECREYCRKYGFTMSKLGQLALIEKLQREGALKSQTEKEGARGIAPATNQASSSTNTSVVVPLSSSSSSSRSHHSKPKTKAV